MYRKSASGWLKHLDFWAIDLISLEHSFFCAYLIRHGSMNPYGVSIYRNMSLMLIFLDVCVLFCGNPKRGTSPGVLSGICGYSEA